MPAGRRAAVWTGMAQASSEWCTWMPADGQVEPQAIADMIGAVDDSDLVLLMRDEGERRWWRQVVSFAVQALVRIMLGFGQRGYSGVFLVRRQIVQNVPPSVTTGVQNYAVVLHCRRNGYRIRQVHTVMKPRMSGRSKVANLSTTLRTLRDIVKLRLVR